MSLTDIVPKESCVEKHLSDVVPEESCIEKYWNSSLPAVNSMKRSPSADSLSSSINGARTCVCSPTKHPGSFRCRYHRSSLSSSSSSPSMPPPHPRHSESQKSSVEAK
ncbi:hypothetical protein AMTRI_Chr01g126900 [Amborella trichopoda]|uniref:Uncharacterized protein n=1 Tax=Amborella trichopoda TaxID=13333 RepID=W1NUL7_AMBTC|nr:hypothetical protein AMTR_s00101p00043810 [Amborella trichopoda]